MRALIEIGLVTLKHFVGGATGRSHIELVEDKKFDNPLADGDYVDHDYGQHDQLMILEHGIQIDLLLCVVGFNICFLICRPSLIHPPHVETRIEHLADAENDQVQQVPVKQVVVASTEARTQPVTVMVELLRARLAYRTVICPRWLPNLAALAEGKTGQIR